jgi:hypothetical protein
MENKRGGVIVRWHEAESIWVEALVTGSRQGYHRPSVLDPKPKYTTDGYQAVQSNDGTIGIPRGIKERTFAATLALQDSAEAGI